MSAPESDPLRVVVGVAAIVAPILHSATDLMEWTQHGFSATQLWLNYAAFLPMPWLLLGLYAVRGEGLGLPALVGALLHGVAFTYFAHTTLYALATDTPSYEALWRQLGATYTLHGALMVGGGLLFAGAALRVGGLPRPALLLFAAGLLANLVLALVPAPDLMQTLGTALRNAGLVGMGHAILFGSRGAGVISFPGERHAPREYGGPSGVPVPFVIATQEPAMTAFHHSCELPLAPATVFAAIADPARLARWWGPDGFSNSFEVFEFRPGGRWTFTMHGPDGTRYPNEAVFAEIRPGALVRIRHTCAPLFDLTIELQECPAGTRIVWVQRFDDPELARSLRPIVEPANEQNLDRLARELAAGGRRGA